MINDAESFIDTRPGNAQLYHSGKGRVLGSGHYTSRSASIHVTYRSMDFEPNQATCMIRIQALHYRVELYCREVMLRFTCLVYTLWANVQVQYVLHVIV